MYNLPRRDSQTRHLLGLRRTCFRGDECVSFGWCFWHRACYGCLLYGSRAIYQGVPIQDLFRDEEESERDGCGGKEVDKVPLCAAYVVEVDGVTEEITVINRGLRRVEKVDGGLTRKRWEANNNERSLKSASAWQPPIYRTGDGVTGDEGTSSNSSSNFRDTSKSVIWVDIFDPINGPSFKPSPLKPIPLFMQRPASPIREPHRRVTTIDTHLQAPPHLRKPRSAPGSAYPRSPEESTISNHQSMRQRSPSPSVLDASRSPMPPREYGDRPSSPEALKNYTKDEELSEVRHRQAVSWVREEPLKRPSSRLAPSRHSDLNRSEANTSTYRTPPEYPDQVLRTPYPLPLSTVRTARPLPSQLTSHSQRTANTAPQSSEYLDRYQPMMAIPAHNPEVRRLRRVAASLSEEGLARTRSEQSEGNNDWGTVGSELRRFFMGR